MRTFNKESRVARLKELIRRLDSGVDVQARDIKTVIGAEHYKEYKRNWEEQIQLRTQEKPDEIKTYEAMLKQALLLNGKLEAYSGRKSVKSNVIVNRAEKKREIEGKTDAAFERAREYLEEILEQDPSLKIWFDRDIDLSIDGNVSLDPIGMPRVITSRSMERLSGAKEHFGLMSKREMKMDALKSRLEAIERESTTQSNTESVKLREILSRLKARS